MNFVGLVGSDYSLLYNRKFLEFIRLQSKLKFELEILLVSNNRDGNADTTSGAGK